MFHSTSFLNRAFLFMAIAFGLLGGSSLYADDLCMDTSYYGGSWLFPQHRHPIRHINNGSVLQNVAIEMHIDGFAPNGPMSNIGIEDNSKTSANDNPDGGDPIFRAESANYSPLPFIGTPMCPCMAFNSGNTFHLGNMSGNMVYDIWTGKFFVAEMMSRFFSSTRFYATYTKNGVRYRKIINACGSSIPGASINDSAVISSDKEQPMTFDVTISGRITGDMADAYDGKSYIHYHTEDGTARAGTDYTKTEGMLVIEQDEEIENGSITKTITVPVRANARAGKFYVILDNAIAARITGERATGTIQVSKVYKKSPFEVWDIFRDGPSGNDFSVSTKIADQAFDLRVGSLNSAGTGTESKKGVNAKFGLFDGEIQVGDLKCIPKGVESIDFDLTIDHVHKKLTPRIFYCSDYLKIGLISMMKTLPLQDCGAFNKDNAVPEYSRNGKKVLFYHEGDTFAVRPAKYAIATDKEDYSAGEDFKITFKALNGSDNNAEHFNEKFRDSCLIKKTEAKRGCAVGTFEPSFNADDQWKFDQGTLQKSTSYGEIGEVTITLSDVKECQKRFAGIDCKDSAVAGNWDPASGTAIASAAKSLVFKPDHFGLRSTISDFFVSDDSSSRFTYLSSDLAMSPHFGLSIAAKSKKNGTLHNFNDKCYGEDVQMNIKLKTIGFGEKKLPPKNLGKPKFGFQKGSVDTTNSIIDATKPITETPIGSRRGTDHPEEVNIANIQIAKSLFDKASAGEIGLNLGLNFERDEDRPVNPFVATVESIHVESAQTKIKGEEDINKSITYLYAQVHVPSSRYDDISGDSAPLPVSVQVYCDTWPDDKTGIDAAQGQTSDAHWWLSTHHNTDMGHGTIKLDIKGEAKLSNSDVNITHGGIDKSIRIKYTGATRPANVTIDINTHTDSWLRSGQEVTQRFIGSSKWAGDGSGGHVVESSASKQKTNRLNW